jgi:hypothetical protein
VSPPVLGISCDLVHDRRIERRRKLRAELDERAIRDRNVLIAELREPHQVKIVCGVETRDLGHVQQPNWVDLKACRVRDPAHQRVRDRFPIVDASSGKQQPLDAAMTIARDQQSLVVNNDGLDFDSHLHTSRLNGNDSGSRGDAVQRSDRDM